MLALCPLEVTSDINCTVLSCVTFQVVKDKRDCSVSSIVDSAIMFLLYERKVDVHKCKKASEFVDYLSTVSRVVENWVEDEPNLELDCVTKYVRCSPIAPSTHDKHL